MFLFSSSILLKACSCGSGRLTLLADLRWAQGPKKMKEPTVLLWGPVSSEQSTGEGPRAGDKTGDWGLESAFLAPTFTNGFNTACVSSSPQ